MKILRFVFPFLFIRNWHTGEWELSRGRLYAFSFACAAVLVVLFVMYGMQAPIEYTNKV